MALARSKIALASFSRSQEFEADAIGVGIAARAGFDPFGASRLLASMGRNAELRVAGHGGDPRSLDFLSSHPATPERVKNAAVIARQVSVSGRAHRDKAAYLASVDGRTYGEDPVDGFVRVPPGQSLVEYLNSGWITNIENGSVEELTVNGVPAATATATGNLWAFRLYVLSFGGEVYRFIFAAKDRTPEADHAFRESIQTFRHLSLQEMRSTKPLHLKIVKVQPGDTVESLATRMALALDHQVERLEVLNGLEPDEQVKTGDLIKIIVE